MFASAMRILPLGQKARGIDGYTIYFVRAVMANGIYGNGEAQKRKAMI